MQGYKNFLFEILEFYNYMINSLRLSKRQFGQNNLRFQNLAKLCSKVYFKHGVATKSLVFQLIPHGIFNRKIQNSNLSLSNIELSKEKKRKSKVNYFVTYLVTVLTVLFWKVCYKEKNLYIQGNYGIIKNCYLLNLYFVVSQRQFDSRTQQQNLEFKYFLLKNHCLCRQDGTSSHIGCLEV